MVEVDALASSYTEARLKEQAAKKVKDEARDRLAALLGDERKVQSVRWKVTKFSRNYETVDKRGLREKFGAEAIDEFVKTTTSDQVRVVDLQDEEQGTTP
jgi:hypothetical protein